MGLGEVRRGAAARRRAKTSATVGDLLRHPRPAAMAERLRGAAQLPQLVSQRYRSRVPGGTHVPEPQWKACTGTTHSQYFEADGAPGRIRTFDLALTARPSVGSLIVGHIGPFKPEQAPSRALSSARVALFR